MPGAKGRLVRSFEYVNQPYDRVRAALLADPVGLFSDATRAAASRAHSVAAELRVSIGGLDVSTEIAIVVGESEENTRKRVTRIPVEWEAAQRPRLFPFMRAVLTLYPLTSTETQLDFAGRYQPPLGPLGGVLDAAVGHRIAEASVHRFVTDVAQHLRSMLAESTGS